MPSVITAQRIHKHLRLRRKLWLMWYVFLFSSSQGGSPCKVGVAVTDLTTGLYAQGAIMAALIQRQKSGRGQKVDCSLLASQVFPVSMDSLFICYFVSCWLTLSEENGRRNGKELLTTVFFFLNCQTQPRGSSALLAFVWMVITLKNFTALKGRTTSKKGKIVPHETGAQYTKVWFYHRSWHCKLTTEHGKLTFRALAVRRGESTNS